MFDTGWILILDSMDNVYLWTDLNVYNIIYIYVLPNRLMFNTIVLPNEKRLPANVFGY